MATRCYGLVLLFLTLQIWTTSTLEMSVDASVTNITIDELKTFQKTPSATIVDVREVKELQESGILPSSINIPLGTLKEALEENNERFEKKYSRPKPLIDNPIIFSCRSGRRSFMASQTALSLGYKKVYNFAGGWLEWEEMCGRSATC